LVYSHSPLEPIACPKTARSSVEPCRCSIDQLCTGVLPIHEPSDFTESISLSLIYILHCHWFTDSRIKILRPEISKFVHT
jgi:hypothetical protein